MATSAGPGTLRARVRRIARFGRWQIVAVCSAAALIVSISLEEFAGYDAYRYFFPMLIGVWFLCVLRFRFNWPPPLRELVRPFPSPNLWLLMTGGLLLLYPFSLTLQIFGYLPLAVFVALVDLLIWGSKRKLELVTLPAGLGLLVFAWLWELAGRQSMVVLPVDLPGVQNAQFTPEGTAKTLLHAITSFPWREPPLIEKPPPVPAQRVTVQKFSAHASHLIELGSNPLPGRGETVLQDAPHILSNAELGGIHLEPVYHALRHLRHEPTIEAQILIGGEGTLVGGEGSLTLGLRRSDFPPSCFSEELPYDLLKLDIRGRGQGRKAVQELQALVDQDLADELKTEKKRTEACNPRWADTLRKWLAVSEIPTDQDERISNVTVVKLRPEEQLTQLVDRAVLEGMGKIDPEFLGLYYEDNDRRESALRYYREALPYAVLRATKAHASSAERARLASLLIAVAHLEVNPTPDNDGPREQRAKEAFEAATNHYATAIALVPEDARVHALQGRFLTVNAIALFREGFLQEQDAAKYYREAQDHFLEVVDRRKTQGLQSELGIVPAAQLRAVSYRNLAYAEVRQAEMLIPARRRPLPKEAEQLLNDAEQYLRKSVQEGANEYPANDGRRENIERCVADKSEHMIEDCAAKSLDKKSRDYADVLGTLGYIKLLRGDCVASLDAFDPAETVLIDLVDFERLLLIEEPYSKALESCGSDDDQKSFHRVLKDLFLGIDLRSRQYYDASAKNFEVAFELAKQMSAKLPAAVKFSASVAYVHGQLLRQWACDARTGLDDHERDVERREAKLALDMAVKLDRQGWAALSYRAQLLAMTPGDMPADLAQALADASEAARAEPHEPGPKLALGLVGLARGDLETALSSFEEAAKLAAHTPETHYLLGFALMQKGKIERAKDEWEYARALDPEMWAYRVNPLPGCGPRLGPNPATAAKVGPRKGTTVDQQPSTKANRPPRMSGTGEVEIVNAGSVSP